MTLTDILIEVLLVTIAKAVAVICVVAMIAIVVAAFLKGRGAESVWPDGLEPQQADAPASPDALKEAL